MAGAQREPGPGAEGDAEPSVIGFYLAPGFPLLSMAAAIDPLRQANRLSGRALYRWVLVSEAGAPVTSSAAIELSVDHAIDTAPRCDLLVVCAGLEPARHAGVRARAWLRRLHRLGRRLGALSTGAYLLAEAGILDGRRCAVHWESAAEFHERFPNVVRTRELFVVDGPFLTSSGGTATLDMMLHVVATAHGVALASAIADQLNHAAMRLEDEIQRLRPEVRFGITNAKLSRLVAAMEASVDAPLDLSVLARQVGLSRRQVERLFRTHLGRTPSDFYLGLRMERARMLVARSSLDLADIARNCGYESPAFFARVYRRHFGVSPAAARQAAKAGRAAAGRPPADGGRDPAP
ncbi:GlxA family transcriptional regulator [Aureimonas flava]|uniref:GlxA family transcriptional regulator n=1 Tax=Aureimonas flava TaxID=2320271 RepID=A0A3A1WLZ5_9HYPH|nr:GlxA family transcriptional regulator [Aureimonas flava]RIY02576.1 GlxA family transcriptional regulator [Aureimonas flava]